MSEEEASFGVVRIGVRLAELVMNSMVSSPFVDIILWLELNFQRIVVICISINGQYNLAGNCLSYGGQEAKGPLGFVAPVAPKPMSPASDSQSAKQSKEKS